ncbi:MAG TPA: type II secretion system F family protein [Acidimicrobiales bacterium]|nr:type II secretion system F family protein [Acidimicrobiales bacterium]
MDPSLLVMLATLVTGAALVVAARLASRRPVVDVGELLTDFQVEAPVSEFQQKLTEPLHVRVGRTIATRLAARVGSLTPANYLDTVHQKLLLAGRANRTRAETVVALQVVAALCLGAGAVGFVVLARPSPTLALAALVLLPLGGLLYPIARLNRETEKRKQAILDDLPDTLDLLAISVEAGMGFEGALSVVCQYFKSPLADEFSLTLREMELGLPRHEAFHNLKDRTQVPDLSSFVQALVQADALGIPIGRVLKTQSTEMRSKRRMWAREKAGKLPVKIMFPLVLFIFPPVMIIVLGPAVGSLSGI